MNTAVVYRMTDATVLRTPGGAADVAAYAGARTRIKLIVPPLCETMRADLSVIAASMRSESAMLAAPCTHWLAVFEHVVAAQAQSSFECNARLKGEIARHRAWEAFMGDHGLEWARQRFPPLDPLDSDETTWRDANWIDHPQFVAWYTAGFGSSPLEVLARRSLLDFSQDYVMNIQRLKIWVTTPEADGMP
ncbi:hypothetical protein AURDEDRAFT_162050 [Auricularia subglabra TFB-10046 SS5]|nr:hypothetical protein AURDEDRAFT_162050 [Auricularia subglabra TFB-10046 SS5]